TLGPEGPELALDGLDTLVTRETGGTVLEPLEHRGGRDFRDVGHRDAGVAISLGAVAPVGVAGIRLAGQALGAGDGVGAPILDVRNAVDLEVRERSGAAGGLAGRVDPAPAIGRHGIAGHPDAEIVVVDV